ncbi:MAG: hypothetical protein M3Y28_04205, partial [Armatimonadota bacterium]|nr:hypothetical protein [Armatimonadota bacterium]
VTPAASVSSGETIFTLLGFAGLYALLGLVFLFLLVRLLAAGPNAKAERPEPQELLETLDTAGQEAK